MPDLVSVSIIYLRLNRIASVDLRIQFKNIINRMVRNYNGHLEEFRITGSKVVVTVSF